MNFGEKLVGIRKSNKLSQEKFAEMLGVTRQTVSNWENLKNYPDISTLIMISNKFDISLDSLLKDDKLMVNNIDTKIKRNKILKVIITLLVLIIVLYSILFYLFPEVVGGNPKNNGKAWITCTNGDEQMIYQLAYNKVFKYTLGSSWTYYNKENPYEGSEMENKYFTKDIKDEFLRQLDEKDPKQKDEHIKFVKEYYESVGSTCEDGFPDWYIGGTIG